jgi:hypothetical protein
MPKPDANQTLRNLDRRLSNIEQFLPALATRHDLHAAIAPLVAHEEMHAAVTAAVAPLATRDEMHVAIAAAVAPLPTRDEMRTAIRAEGEETRRHFDVVAESIRSEVRVIAEGHGHLTHRMDTLEGDTKRAIAGLDRRVLRLEAKAGQ